MFTLEPGDALLSRLAAVPLAALAIEDKSLLSDRELHGLGSDVEGMGRDGEVPESCVLCRFFLVLMVLRLHFAPLAGLRPVESGAREVKRLPEGG